MTEERKLSHAQEAAKHCRTINEAINGLCDILDISDDGFGEYDRLGAYKDIFQKASAWEKQYEDYIYGQKEKAEIASCMKRKFQVADFLDQLTTVYPRLGLYEVREFMDKPMHILSIKMYSEDGEPYATLTKSFGEFIAVKNCAYIDTKNCPYSKKLLELGVAKDTGITKASGFCRYPLWEFDEDFLKDIGGEQYEQYSKEFDDYMSFGEYEDEEPEIDSFEQSM